MICTYIVKVLVVWFIHLIHCSFENDNWFTGDRLAIILGLRLEVRVDNEKEYVSWSCLGINLYAQIVLYQILNFMSKIFNCSLQILRLTTFISLNWFTCVSNDEYKGG